MSVMEIAMKELGELIAAAQTPQTAIDLLKKETLTGVKNVVDGFGADPTGVNDSLDAIQNAIDGGGVVILPPGDYWCSDSLIFSSNLILIFYKARIFISGPTATGAVITNVYNGGVGVTDFTENVVLINPQIDANHVPGENGIGFANCQNIHIFNPQIENTLFDAVKMGGRALQFEGGENGVKDCYTYNPIIRNCSIGLNAQGIAAEPAQNICFFNVTMENVDIPGNFDSTVGSGATSHDEMSVLVDGLSLRNCGRITGAYGPAEGGGIITGDRAYGVTVRNIKVINDPDYGKIGGLVHGKLRLVTVENVEIDAEIVSLFNGTPRGYGNPSLSSIPAGFIAKNIRSYGTQDYVVQAYSNTTDHMDNCRLDDIEIKSVNLGIVDNNAAALTNCLASIRLMNGRKGFVNATFKAISEAGNSLTILPDEIGKNVYTEIFHTKSNVANNTETPLFEVALPPHGRVFIEYFITTAFVSSGASAAGTAVKGVATAVSNGNGVIDSDVAASPVSATSLLTVTSQTLVATITNDETNDKVIFNVTQTNSSSATEAVTVHAWIHYSFEVSPRMPKVTLL